MPLQGNFLIVIKIIDTCAKWESECSHFVVIVRYVSTLGLIVPAINANNIEIQVS